jgi:hypothetical protein
MSDKSDLNEISDSVRGLDNSLKEIVNIMKPKQKKANIGVTIGWISVGALSLYAVYFLEKIIARM